MHTTYQELSALQNVGHQESVRFPTKVLARQRHRINCACVFLSSTSVGGLPEGNALPTGLACEGTGRSTNLARAAPSVHSW